jgi:hypothetical protein
MAGTWGFHRPPKLPEGWLSHTPSCKTDIGEILASRWEDVKRQWDNPSFGGFQAKRQQAWSTRDRPAYLHHNTIGK